VPTILAIETSVSHASITLWDGEHMHEYSFESHRKQNQLLFEPLAAVMELLGDQKIDTILVGTGPGSYSGSRIAIAAAHGLAMVHGAQVAGVCSFYGTDQPASEKLVAIGDARRGSYFYYPLEQAELHPSPTLLSSEAFKEAIQTMDHPALFTFETKNELPIKGVELAIPTASGLIRYWKSLSTEQHEKLLSVPVEPLYLRAPFITKSTKSHPLLGK